MFKNQWTSYILLVIVKVVYVESCGALLRVDVLFNLAELESRLLSFIVLSSHIFVI
jgi:hypothetical protein